ncbi:hypothetical protein [Thalassoroseus pseudoceratinae]|uniref:hypothetical protein n=1 Tax=Thalassoroseus pseudoceratinae TaxID=2713176 RepID=UPI0014200427|nr:hypothetical protein [Thalassoroseus pseudoceratinae]
MACENCDWSRTFAEEDVETSPSDSNSDELMPNRCLVCGCEDLWRQKDFPAQLGLLMVGLGAILSTIAWSQYRPLWAIGILMVFALIDLVLYAVMPDVLVCYRCEARHRHGNFGEEHPKFDLEVAERYRQQAIRMEEASQKSS